MPSNSHANGQTRTYVGLVYLFVTILVSISGNVLFQSFLFPAFPYPICITMVSSIFPALFLIPACRKEYPLAVRVKYVRLAPWLLLNSLCSNIMYNLSLSLTSMSAVTVITSLSTLFTLLFARLLLNTPIVLGTIVSVHLSIVGSILVVFSSSSSSGTSPVENDHILGCCFALISAACSGLTSVLFQKFQIKHSDLYLAISGSIALLYFSLYLALNWMFVWEAFTVRNFVDGNSVSLLALNGILSSVCGYYVYMKAIKRLSPVTLNVLWTLSIPLSVIVDYYRGLIGDITPTFLVGALIVLLSIILVPIEQTITAPSTPQDLDEPVPCVPMYQPIALSLQ